MAHRRTGPARSFRGSTRRDTVWFSMTATQNVLVGANSAAIILSLNAAALALRPFTIVRTRGLVLGRSDQLSANEDYSASLGYAVVSDQAVAIGVTAVPTPVTDLASDFWFVHETIMGRFDSGTNVGLTELGGVAAFSRYDSKAMRKVDIGQDLVVVLESTALNTGIEIDHQARMLIKVH